MSGAFQWSRQAPTLFVPFPRAHVSQKKRNKMRCTDSGPPRALQERPQRRASARNTCASSATEAHHLPQERVPDSTTYQQVVSGKRLHIALDTNTHKRRHFFLFSLDSLCLRVCDCVRFFGALRGKLLGSGVDCNRVGGNCRQTGSRIVREHDNGVHHLGHVACPSRG